MTIRANGLDVGYEVDGDRAAAHRPARCRRLRRDPISRRVVAAPGQRFRVHLPDARGHGGDALGRGRRLRDRRTSSTTSRPSPTRSASRPSTWSGTRWAAMTALSVRGAAPGARSGRWSSSGSHPSASRGRPSSAGRWTRSGSSATTASGRRNWLAATIRSRARRVAPAAAGDRRRRRDPAAARRRATCARITRPTLVVVRRSRPVRAGRAGRGARPPGPGGRLLVAPGLRPRRPADPSAVVRRGPRRASIVRRARSRPASAEGRTQEVTR